MPEKLDQCVQSVMAEGKSESEAYAICTAMFQDSDRIRVGFEDVATYNATDKTAISVRDGVLEYYGAELGMEPADKIFTIYRSPATIANCAMKMVGIPLTDEHVSLDMEPPESGSTVTSAEMIDAHQPDTGTTIAVKNKLALSETAVMMLEQKQQLSLGYYGDLVPHSQYDFEQIDLIPHHLAAVPAGRCGSLCSFLDRSNQTNRESNPMPQLHKAFQDAEGAMSLEQIVEIATNLPEAIRAVPVDKLQELMPALQEIHEIAKSVGAGGEQAPAEEEGQATEDEGMEGEEDEEMEGMDGKKYADAKPHQFTDEELQKAKREFADAEIQRYASVVTKARDHLPETYDFADKSPEQIMRDTLATQYGNQRFEDSELPTAFKMLRKVEDYKQFGDHNPDQFAGLEDKELGK